MKPSKESFKNWVRNFMREEISKGKKTVEILDLGSGTSNNFMDLIKEFPHMRYTGVEPYQVAFKEAKENLKDYTNQVTLYDQPAYEVKELEGKTYDLVCSLSVLEHVKQLEKFLKFSAEHVAPGGILYHLWDNAHELMSISMKERIQCWLCNNFPAVVPELKFAHAVYPDNVVKILEKYNMKFVEKDFYHLRSTITAIKKLRNKVYDMESIQKFLDYEKFLKGKFESKDLEKEFVTCVVVMKK
jgi:SAM-dependent methyltransferase